MLNHGARLFSVIGLVAGLAALATPATAYAEDCLLCGHDSKDGCAGAQQCRGSREHCKSIGCEITGTGSCSTAANVKICSDASQDEGAQMCLDPLAN